MTTADPFRVRPLSDADVARLEPADLLEDERRCLGAAIRENGLLGGALSGLAPEHFCLPAHRELFALMQQWSAEGQHFDVDRLGLVFQQHKQLQALGGVAYLQQLLQHGRQSLGNVGANARLLIRKAGAGPRPENRGKPQAASNQRATVEPPTGNFLTTLAEVEAKPLDWVWEPYLPSDAVAVLSGDPGVGKSFLALAISKEVASGQWSVASKNKQPAAGEELETPQPPTENRDLSTENSSPSVLYVGAGESPEQVLRPRFDALGGDARRLHLLRPEASFQHSVSSFPPDSSLKAGHNPQPSRKLETGNRKLVPLLAAALQKTRARLVIVDPLESYLAVEGIGPRSQKFRRWLDQLAGLAHEYHCCVLLVRTLTRSPAGRAMAGALGSVELAGAVRSHLVAGRSAADPAQRALVQVKNNWGPLGPALGYAIDDAGKFCWTGASTLTVEEMLAATPDAEQKSALQEAESFLRTTLARGPERAATVQQEARNLGITGVTLRRAKRRLEVVSKKCGGGPWQWAIPVASNATNGPRPSTAGPNGNQPAASLADRQEPRADCKSDDHLEHLPQNPEEEESRRHEELRQRRKQLVDEYLERTGQKEKFITSAGIINVERFNACVGPLYQLLNRVEELDRRKPSAAAAPAHGG